MRISDWSSEVCSSDRGMTIKIECHAMKRLAVYCGSATPADPVYIETARHVGRTLASRGIGVVYGGGRLGLMGAVADSALEAGGEVIGVIPDALVGTEVAHRSDEHTYELQSLMST